MGHPVRDVAEEELLSPAHAQVPDHQGVGPFRRRRIEDRGGGVPAGHHPTSGAPTGPAPRTAPVGLAC